MLIGLGVTVKKKWIKCQNKINNIPNIDLNFEKMQSN